MRWGLTIAVFLNAAACFVVQPMIGRATTPLLGGSPAVWNACLLFFQTCYLLAALGATIVLRLPFRAACVAYPAVLVVAGLRCLFGDGVGRLPEEASLLTLMGMLLREWGVVIVPAFMGTALLTAAAGSRSRAAFSLYAASNAGSLVGLLAYPFLIERSTDLSDQWHVWRLAFLGIAALLAIGWLTRRPMMKIVSFHESVPLARRLRWTAIAFLSTANLMSVSRYLTTDLPPLPFLWVLPLGLFLFSYVVAFTMRLRFSADRLSRWFGVAMMPMLLSLFFHAGEPYFLLLAVHAGGFFLGCWAAHRRLAETVPEASEAGLFQFHLALGGWLGGVMFVFLLPVALPHTGPIEYAFGLIAMYLVAAGPGVNLTVADRVFAIAFVLAILFSSPLFITPNDVTLKYYLGIPAGLTLGLLGKPKLFAGAWVILACIQGTNMHPAGQVLESHRTPLGFLYIAHHPTADRTRLLHGGTIHGEEDVRPATEMLATATATFGGDGWSRAITAYAVAYDRPSPIEPLTYYSRRGPAGEVFRRIVDADPSLVRIQAVGLGIGTLASYARPYQKWTFFELEPEAERIARNLPFHTLAESRAGSLHVIVGDARRTLSRAEMASADVLILDAFSSDTVPQHLLTAEAFAIYDRVLRKDGILLIHLSNRLLDLAPFVAGQLSRTDPRLECWTRHDLVTAEARQARGHLPSIWIVASRRPLQAKLRLTEWERLRPKPETPRWTDERIDLLPLFRGNED